LERNLGGILNRLEEDLHKHKDYKLLFPNFKNQILSSIRFNTPHLELRNPVRAIELALKQAEFLLEFSSTKRLIDILGEGFSEKLQHWSKLGINLNTSYIYGTKCTCEIKHYSFNDRLGFAQWRKHIKDDDLQLRLTFGEPLIDIFKDWRERRAKDIEDRYNRELNEFATSFQIELDSIFSDILKKVTL